MKHFIETCKQDFIVEEGILELESSCLTPTPVLRGSDHAEKFRDTYLCVILKQEIGFVLITYWMIA